MIRFGSVCSGIEAASVAWHPLGWRAAWLSEIEPFPCAVLAHHYPDVLNLGDMTTLPERIRTGEVEAPDVFCGGTPCQAFSVAGLRKSLDDARGNLSLTFCEIANAIDFVRFERGEQPAVVFWENVPGVLNTKDNAFGCFLAGLAGEADPLVPPGGKWSNAGAVFGPQRAVAWRVLDAQYFGVAQRRRRVFVVASAREGFDPAAVLFELDGVRRDTAPSRKAGQNAAAGTLRSTDGGSDVDHARAGHLRAVTPSIDASFGRLQGCSGLATDKGAEAGHILAFGGNRTSGSIDISPALLAQPGSGYKGDFESETFLVQSPGAYKCAGCDRLIDPAWGWGKWCDYCGHEHGTGRGTPLVPVAFQPGNLARGCGSAPSTEVFPTLKADHGRGQSDQDPHVMVPVAFDTTQVTSATNRSNPKPGDPCHPLAAGAHAPAIAFDSRQDCISSDKVFGSLGSSSPQAQAVAVSLRGREGGATAELGDEVGNCLRASSGGGDKPHVLTAMQVRRLTPTECERLQGFPDGYTAIPWRKKPASECPDGPRYKALGNSWAVPVVRWLGGRILNWMWEDIC